MYIFAVERCDERLVQFSNDRMGQFIADVLDSLDLGGFVCPGLIIIKKFDQNSRAANQVFRDLGKHVEERGVLTQESQHVDLRLHCRLDDLKTIAKTGQYLMHYDGRQMVPSPPLSIFVVEDDEDISKLIQMHLSAAGFAVRSFSTATGVIKEAEQQTPALFLLDVMLPGSDGFSLCREIRRHELLKAVPVIVVTAKAGASERTAALNSGADDYLVKPFSRVELISRVRALCERSQS